MKNRVDTQSQSGTDLEEIWRPAAVRDSPEGLGPAACTRQGRGRDSWTTLIQGRQQLGPHCVEPPLFPEAGETI